MKLQKVPLQTLFQDQFHGQPTPIQETVYSPLMDGQSVVMASPTGTGKTLAYLWPILDRMEANQTLQTLILSPNQELVAQLLTVVRQWGAPLNIRAQGLMGGANLQRQIENLKEKPEIIVATPGRLLEVLDLSRKLKLHQVTTLVYDEADSLWTDERQDVLIGLQKRLMRDVQVVWASATVDDQLIRKARALKPDLALITLKQGQGHSDHHLLISPNRKKLAQLKRLAQVSGMKALVFFDRIDSLVMMESKLQFEGIPTLALHGRLSQVQRQNALRLFNQGKATYLLTTDVGSRGLDIPELPYVIHYDLARQVETYLHRSGRTGRNGQEGRVISLVNEQEGRDLTRLLEKETIQLHHSRLYNRALVPWSEPTPEEPSVLDSNEGGLTGAKRTGVKQSSPPSSARRTDSESKTAAKARKHKQRLRNRMNKGKPKRLTRE